MKCCLYAGLDLSKDELFESLLSRDGNKVRQELTAFLNQSSEQYPPSIIFYCKEHEVEEMVEVVEGKVLLVFSLFRPAPPLFAN